jgi:hypothetical protein
VLMTSTSCRESPSTRYNPTSSTHHYPVSSHSLWSANARGGRRLTWTASTGNGKFLSNTRPDNEYLPLPPIPSPSTTPPSFQTEDEEGWSLTIHTSYGEFLATGHDQTPNTYYYRPSIALINVMADDGPVSNVKFISVLFPLSSPLLGTLLLFLSHETDRRECGTSHIIQTFQRQAATARLFPAKMLCII